MSLPQGKTPVRNQIKTHILCSTLIRIFIHLDPHFDPPCSTFWSILLHILIHFAPHFDPIAPHFDPHYSTSAPQLSSFLNLKLTDTRFFKARAQHISWGHIRHCSVKLCHIHHAPALYLALHSSPKLRHFWFLTVLDLCKDFYFKILLIVTCIKKHTNYIFLHL